VTKLTRDVASGTASQEINFWLSLERALEGIEAQLRSDEVNMVMDCLRNAKRFHATVSFIADTGLKDATDNGALIQSHFVIPFDLCLQCTSTINS
jgi:pilus assembly protein TadC